jgi:hypothetical protein
MYRIRSPRPVRGTRRPAAGSLVPRRPFVVTAVKVLDERVPSDHDASVAVLLEAAHRSQPRLQPAVVALDPVVGMAVGATPCEWQQLLQYRWVHQRPIGGDLGGPALGRADSPLEEPAGSRASRPSGDEHVDELAELVDRSIDKAPLPSHPHIRLIHLPAVTDRMPTRPSGLDQQRREPQHPPVDRDVIDLDPALGEELFDVAVARPKRRYQRTARTMTSGGKRKPAKADRVAGAGRGRRVLIPAVSPPGRDRADATVPPSRL